MPIKSKVPFPGAFFICAAVAAMGASPQDWRAHYDLGTEAFHRASYAEAAAEFRAAAAGAGARPERFSLLNNLAAALSGMGDLRQAAEVLEQAMGVARPDDAAGTGRVALNLARTLAELGAGNRARDWFLKALDLSRGSGAGLPLRLEVLWESAHYLQESGQADAAERLLAEALEASRGERGGESEEVAEALHHLGAFYYRQKNPWDAEPQFRQEKEIWERIRGPRDSRVAACWNNLATLHADLLDYEGAERNYRRALEIEEAASGRQSEASAIIVGNLAVVYHSSARYTDAIPLYQESIAALEALWGTEDSRLIERLENYGNALRKVKRKKEAKALQSRVKQLQRRQRLARKEARQRRGAAARVSREPA